MKMYVLLIAVGVVVALGGVLLLDQWWLAFVGALLVFAGFAVAARRTQSSPVPGTDRRT